MQIQKSSDEETLFKRCDLDKLPWHFLASQMKKRVLNQGWLCQPSSFINLTDGFWPVYTALLKTCELDANIHR